MLKFRRDGETFEDGRGVAFKGDDGGREVSFLISLEVLRDAFGASRQGKAGYIVAYRGSRFTIEDVARRKYLRDELTGRQAIVIDSFDFSSR